jgi:hypothetical protein
MVVEGGSALEVLGVVAVSDEGSAVAVPPDAGMHQSARPFARNAAAAADGAEVPIRGRRDHAEAKT